MTGDGGLIALTVEEAYRLFYWGGRVADWAPNDWSHQDSDLYNRIATWLDRHEPVPAHTSEGSIRGD